MANSHQGSDFYREYNLADARRYKVSKRPAPHQEQALHELNKWYTSAHTEPRGGILVLPTGGGKTFTACHFICRNPLSDGFKVLWLAHTHHLLEQALFSFSDLVGLIAEPRPRLSIRVVSGTIGHFPVHSIQASDDVVVSSLQTVYNAVNNRHEQLDRFLNSAKGRLFVVFDEAHHSPDPSYRALLLTLRERCPQMHVMGLTATPTYTDEKKRGWLHKLFPQGILYQVDPQTLMVAGILSRPIPEEAQTAFEPSFDERQYEQWVETNRDLPDNIIDTLAGSRERNDYIVGCYVSNRKKYGKTIIFADRWPQCEFLREALRKRGVKADVMYSHVDATPGTVKARNRRTSAENAKVLQDFRVGKLHVLINIRMATEGTDVPDVQTVFLTRQTTSQILLTQMVGRALRGPKFGGTDKAFIVSFIDNWRHRINWAAYDQLAPGLADEIIPEYGKRPPIQLISIDLVRRLARQMDSGINVNPAPYRAFLPIGWYRVEYYAHIEGTDDIEPVGQLVMTFEDEKPCFDRFIKALKTTNLEPFQEDSVHLAGVREELDRWCQKFFSDAEERVGGGLLEDVFSMARHMAQNEKQPPKFFPFDVREQHDLDAIAQDHLAQELTDHAKDAALRGEYTRQDRYWRVMYYTYRQFKSHYDACINRILDASEHGNDLQNHRPSFTTPQAIPLGEPPEELKERVKSRDSFRCLCCGYGKQRTQLQVDHIAPSYHGGNHHFDNLQTLCKTCNNAKGIEKISFRNNQTTLTAAPSRLPVLKTPISSYAKDPEWWEMFIRRTLNLFFRCAAVDSVEIGGKGERFRRWQIRLFPGNNEKWLEPHLASLIQRIREARERAAHEAAPDDITITSERTDGEDQAEPHAAADAGDSGDLRAGSAIRGLVAVLPPPLSMGVRHKEAIGVRNVSPTARDGDGSEISPGSGVVPILKQVEERCLKVVGTGFYLTRYGLFATAAHVLEDLADRERNALEVGYVFEHRGEDGIVLRRIARVSLSNFADVGVGQAENMVGTSPGTPNLRARLSLLIPKARERLVTYAYPENEILDFKNSSHSPVLKADYFEGEFKRQVPPSEHPFIPYPHYETSLEIRSGASGGPVFNACGEIVAIACRGWDFRGGEHEGDNLSAVVPVGYLLSMNATCACPCSPSWEHDRIPQARRSASLSFGELVAYGHIDVGMFRW